MARQKIISDPALFGQPAYMVRTYRPTRRGKNPWLLLAPGLFASVLCAWIDGYIERPLTLIILVVACIFLSSAYRRKLGLGLVYVMMIAAYAYAVHLFGWCC